MRQRFVRFAVFSATAPIWLGAPAVRAQDPNRPAEPPPEARQLQNPMRGDGRTIERGKKLYQVHCVPCHGKAGAADGQMEQRLGYKPRDLTLDRMNSLADGEIFWKISKGTAPMAAFEEELSARDRWDLVSYVRTLVRQAQ
jgi:mono/diheme cytochrome c family protein